MQETEYVIRLLYVINNIYIEFWECIDKKITNRIMSKEMIS
jgi:hypothetical protein